MAEAMSIAAHIAAGAEVRIDALPYVDPEYADPGKEPTPVAGRAGLSAPLTSPAGCARRRGGGACTAMKSVVDGLIAAELKSMPRRDDVLAALPLRPLHEEVARVETAWRAQAPARARV